MRARTGAAFAIALLVVLAATVTVTFRWPRSAALLGTWEEPHGVGIDEEPYSSPANLWLYWGSTTNRRMTGSGEKIRHIFKMGTIQGGEWRDPKFLRKITGPLFRGLSEKCCVSLLFPPFEWDFPIYNPSKAIAQRMRSFVANGNAMIFTGGTMDFEFINELYLLEGNCWPRLKGICAPTRGDCWPRLEGICAPARGCFRPGLRGFASRLEGFVGPGSRGFAARHEGNLRAASRDSAPRLEGICAPARGGFAPARGKFASRLEGNLRPGPRELLAPARGKFAPREISPRLEGGCGGICENINKPHIHEVPKTSTNHIFIS